MHVVFRKSGGFAPIAIGSELDTNQMPAAESAELLALIKASEIMTMKGSTVKGACDVHYYTIDITDGESRHHVKFDQLSIPAQVKPLVQFLEKRSKSMLPD